MGEAEGGSCSGGFENSSYDGGEDSFDVDDVGEDADVDDVGEDADVDDVGEDADVDDVGEDADVDDAGEDADTDDVGEADDYSRPTSFRKGVRDATWENAKDSHGRVRDPGTGQYMSKDQPWDMGHKPGYEFRKHQESARQRNISREEFLDEHNDASHYRPELPQSNRNHKSEDKSDQYFGY